MNDFLLLILHAVLTFVLIIIIGVCVKIYNTPSDLSIYQKIQYVKENELKCVKQQ